MLRIVGRHWEVHLHYDIAISLASWVTFSRAAGAPPAPSPYGHIEELQNEKMSTGNKSDTSDGASKPVPSAVLVLVVQFCSHEM